MIDYTIITVDESRTEKKEYIRSLFAHPEAQIDFVDGRIPEQLALAKKKWKHIETPGPFKAGEFGIFYSVLNCLEYGAGSDGILYFEDDAIPVFNLHERFTLYMDKLDKVDLFALWSPHNQTYDYQYVKTYGNDGVPIYGNQSNISIFDIGHPELCRLYQGYGNVSMYFSKIGCQKLLRYIKERGFFSPIDCLICIACHGGYLNGFSVKPGVQCLINYDWEAPTTVQKSRWGYIDYLMEKNE